MPELDGVRGIAILMVVVYHAFLFSIRPQSGWMARLASYGFSGVDLFFVLSGFLITGILLNAKNRPGYFRTFYRRRALRIWPLYYLLLLFSFGIVPLLSHHLQFPVGDLALLESRNKLVYIFLLQNVWYHGASQPAMLSMTWSLAIEEQFYLLWPWLVLFCSRRNLAFISAAVLLLSPWLRLWAGWRGVSGETIYFLTYYRLDGLSLGALLALWCGSDLFSVRAAKWASLSALALGAPASLWLLGGHFATLWALRYSALALASAGLVLFAIWWCRTNTILGWPLRAGWLRYLGKISYCLYLVHQPVYLALGGRVAKSYIGSGNAAALVVMALGFIVSVAIASLSWHVFESQILKLNDTLQYRRRAEALAAA